MDKKMTIFPIFSTTKIPKKKFNCISLLLKPIMRRLHLIQIIGTIDNRCILFKRIKLHYFMYMFFRLSNNSPYLDRLPPIQIAPAYSLWDTALYVPYDCYSQTILMPRKTKCSITRLHRLNFCNPKKPMFCSLWESCKMILTMSKHFLLSLAESGI